MNSEKKVAIVTGGGSGIGAAIAECLTAQGIHTIIIGRNEKKLSATKENLGADC
jgi:NADP-dependent 3-hydroxy acid dehydrogenase YdfG